MKFITLILVIICFLLFFSCQKKLYRSYPECIDYFDYIKTHWKQKENGFYLIEEIVDSSDWRIYDKPPAFYREWKKYRNTCLIKLTPNEVRQLYGQPTKIYQFYNNVRDKQVSRYIYYISDRKCLEIIPGDNEPDRCGHISFTFFDGIQESTSDPVIHLVGFNFYPLIKLGE
jgi:hypothetical protein